MSAALYNLFPALVHFPRGLFPLVDDNDNDNAADDDGVDGVDGGGDDGVDSDAAPDDGDGNDHLGQPPRLFLHCKGICTSLVTGY